MVCPHAAPQMQFSVR